MVVLKRENYCEFPPNFDSSENKIRLQVKTRQGWPLLEVVSFCNKPFKNYMMLGDSPKNFALDKLSIYKSRDTIGGRFPEWGGGGGGCWRSLLLNPLPPSFSFLSLGPIFSRDQNFAFSLRCLCLCLCERLTKSFERMQIYFERLLNGLETEHR